MKFKSITSIGLALQNREITEAEAVKAYELLKVYKKTQLIMRQINDAASESNLKGPKKEKIKTFTKRFTEQEIEFLNFALKALESKILMDTEHHVLRRLQVKLKND